MKNTMFKYGGVAGIIAAISYIAHDAAGSILYPGYSPLREAVSALTADDSPVLQVTRPFTFVYGIFSVLCCTIFLVYALKQETKLLKIGAILYLAMNVISFVGYSLFPLSGGNDFMHGFVTGLVVVFSILSLILFVITGIREPKFKRLGIAATAAFAFMLVGAILTNIAPESIFGLVERFSTYAAVCFTAYLGCWLRKNEA